MVVRRSDSRRRRLAIDPSTQSGDVEEVGTQASGPGKQKKAEPATARPYGYGAERRSQMKTTDLLPKRFIACALVVFALLACLATINFAAQNVGQWQNVIGQSGQEAFSIRGTGTLSSWFSSFLLIMTGLASLQIYALRQHRCDDYVGTYRLWLWMSALFVIASINCIVDLGGVLTNAFQSIVQQPMGSRPWVPLAIKVGALSALVVRGLFEVKESRGTFALVVFVWVAYCAAAVLQLPAVSDQLVGMGSEMVAGNCFLFGTAALFYAHLIYGRFIYLHAHGLISVKPKSIEKKSRKSKSKVKAKAKTKVKAKPKTKPKEKAAAASTTAKPAAAKSKRKQAKKVEAEAPAPVKVAAKKATAKKAVAKKAVTPPAAPEVAGSTNAATKSPSELLREMADASRAKQTVDTSDQADDYDDYEEEGSVLKMSKSQKRKLRKQQKNQRRAA